MSTTAVALPQQQRSRFARLSLQLFIGIIIIGVSIILALFPEAFAPYDPIQQDYLALLQPPGPDHLLGTDNYGRDVLSRLIFAYRIDLQIAIFGTLFPLLFGCLVGALVGYYGGIADMIFGRIVDVVITFPFLSLVIAIVAVLGPGLVNMYIAVSSVGWVVYARLLRAEIRVQGHQDYAAAGRVMGYSDARIIVRHLLPNAITPVVVYWMTDMALVILLGSSLGYLGLGAQPPTPEWGTLIAEGKNFMETAQWISLYPGIAIVVTGFGFSMLGDGLARLLRRKA
jgi:peptide/nickel transport system permease protein